MNISTKPPSLPADGTELQRRLTDYEGRLVQQNLCRGGELIQHILKAGARAGFGPDLNTWTGPAILLAVEEVKAFEARPKPDRKEVA